MSEDEGNGGNGANGDDEESPSLELIPARPSPPLPAGSVHLALGSSVGQSPLDRLDREAQLALIQQLDASDERQLQYHTLRLEKQAEYQESSLKSAGEGRRQALGLVKTLSLSVLLFVAIVTGALLYKDQFSVAQTIVISSMTFVAGLVGGSGISSLTQRLGGISPHS